MTNFTVITEQVVLAFVAAYCGYLLGGRRERLNRNRRAKDDFLAVVAAQRAKFDAMRHREGEFFEQSVPHFTRALYEVRYFVTAEQWDCLHTVLKEYQSRHRSEFEGRAVLAAVFNAEQGIGKTAHQTLQDFLDRFEKCVNESA